MSGREVAGGTRKNLSRLFKFSALVIVSATICQKRCGNGSQISQNRQYTVLFYIGLK